jgi:hypothetical protein
MTHMTSLASSLVNEKKRMAMKYLPVLVLVISLYACEGAGDRTVTAPESNDEAPTSDPNSNNNVLDTTSSGVNDSTTVVDYDTAVRKRPQ